LFLDFLEALKFECIHETRGKLTLVPPKKIYADAMIARIILKSANAWGKIKDIFWTKKLILC